MIDWKGADFTRYPKSSDLEALFLRLAAAPIALWPSGSRFIGRHRADSDCDFIAQDSPELSATLRALGFGELEPAKAYTIGEDYGTLSRPKDGWSTMFYTQHVDGILVEIVASPTAAVKVKARDLVKMHFVDVHAKMNHPERVRFWRSLCDACAVALFRGNEPNVQIPIIAPHDVTAGEMVVF